MHASCLISSFGIIQHVQNLSGALRTCSIPFELFLVSGLECASSDYQFQISLFVFSSTFTSIPSTSSLFISLSVSLFYPSSLLPVPLTQRCLGRRTTHSPKFTVSLDIFHFCVQTTKNSKTTLKRLIQCGKHTSNSYQFSECRAIYLALHTP